MADWAISIHLIAVAKRDILQANHPIGGARCALSQSDILNGYRLIAIVANYRHFIAKCCVGDAGKIDHCVFATDGKNRASLAPAKNLAGLAAAAGM